jgi:hypothetical protein
VIGKDERLAQTVRILVGETLTVKASIGGVNDAVMVWAEDHDISTDIRASSGEVLDVVGLGKSNTIFWDEIIATYLAAVLVVRLEAVREELIAHKFLHVHHLFGHRV